MINIREVSRHDNTSVLSFGFDSRFHARELFFAFAKDLVAARSPYIRRIRTGSRPRRGFNSGGDGMAFMHFFCASHQRKIEGGFDLDLETLRRMHREPVHVYCPLCSRTHRYLLADAVEAASERRKLLPEPVRGFEGYVFRLANAFRARARALR